MTWQKSPFYVAIAPHGWQVPLQIRDTVVYRIDKGAVLGDRKGPEGYFMVPADEAVTTRIATDGKALLKRLAEYSPYFKMDAGEMHH